MQPNLGFMERENLAVNADVMKLCEVSRVDSRPLAEQLLLDGEVVR